MTFSTAIGCATAQWRDDTIAGATLYTGSDGVTCETTAARLVSPSDRVIKFALATNSKKCHVPLLAKYGAPDLNGGAVLAVLTGWVGVSGQPDTGQIGLASDTRRGGASIIRYIRIGDTGGTDTKIRIYDAGGTLRLTSLSNVSTSGMTEFGILLDAVTGTTTRLGIWINGALEAYADTGVAHATFWSTAPGALQVWGEYLQAGVNRSADMYLEHALCQFSATASDSPFVTPYRRYVGVGAGSLPPTAEAVWEMTVGAGDASPNSWKDVGATRDLAAPGTPPGNDTITSYIQGASGSDYDKRALYTYSAANPVPSTALDVLAVQLGTADRNSGASKFQNYMVLRLSGSQTQGTYTSAAGTTWIGDYVHVARPGGGSWAYTDFDLSAGVSVLQFGIKTPTSIEVGAGTLGGQNTAIPGPHIIYHPVAGGFLDRPHQKTLIIKQALNRGATF